MKRTVGLALVAIGLVAALLTVYWIWGRRTVVLDPRHHAEQMRACWTMAGLLLLTAGNLLLVGLCLLRASPVSRPGEVPSVGNRSPFPLPLYVTMSLSLALLAAYLDTVRWQTFGFLWPFLCIPSIVLMFTGHHLSRLSDQPTVRYTVTAVIHLLYYGALLYPLYRRRYRLARILIGIHLALGFLLLLAITAIVRSE